MFIKEITKSFGNHFAESTLIGKYKQNKIKITTVTKDNKPVAKRFEIDQPNKVIYGWKNLIKKTSHINELIKLDMYI